VFLHGAHVEVTLEEARAAWGTDVIIFGGVPSVILEPSFAEAEFEAYMRDLFRVIAPGDASSSAWRTT